jgi:hypothetical protein
MGITEGTTMRMLLAITFVLIAFHQSKADHIFLINDYGERITLFQWYPDAWDKPGYKLPQKTKAAVNLDRPGRYFFTLFDGQNREREIGWFDLHLIYDRDPKAEVGVNQLFVSKAVCYAENYYDSNLRRWVQRTKEKIIREPTGKPVCYVYSGGKKYNWDDFVKRFKSQR